MTEKLTPKQARFVDEYLIDLNGTQAAIRAGFSKKSAHDIAAQLLGKTHIKAAIDAAKAARMQRVNIDADYVLRRLYEMAEADRKDIYDENGSLKPVKDWPEVWRKGMVTGIEVNELWEGQGADRVRIGEVKKVRTETPLAILQTLGKHIKVNAFQENVKIAGLDALGDRLERAMKRDG